MTLSGLPAAWWGLVKQVATAWLDVYVPSMGAAMAHYTMFSLAPLLLVVVSAAGLVFGEDAARSEIQAQLQDLMGQGPTGNPLVACANEQTCVYRNFSICVCASFAIMGGTQCMSSSMADGRLTNMTVTTHSARITGPLTYANGDGATSRIPLGPCLVEQISGSVVDIIWGANGQSSAALPVEEVEAAANQGHLVLLD